MNSATHPKIVEFKKQIQLVCSAIRHHFVQQEEDDILIDKNCFMQGKFIVPLKEKTSLSLTIENFMEQVTSIWEQELKYEDEFITLKDKIYEEFNNFSLQFSDKSIADFINSQAEEIIDRIFFLAKFYEKQQAGEFCTGILNGFDCDIPENLPQIIYYIYYQKLFSPYPIGLIDFVQQSFRNTSKLPTYQEARTIINDIIQHIKSHLQMHKINIKDCLSKTEFKKEAKNLHLQRKVCVVSIDNHIDYFSTIIKYKKKCIESIRLEFWPNSYLLKKIDFAYDSLKIMDKIEDSKIIELVERVPATVKNLNLWLGNSQLATLEKFSLLITKFSVIQELNLDMSYNKIGDKGIEVFSAKLRCLSRLTSLTLHFNNYNIKDCGLTEFSAALSNLKKMTVLHLDFNQNEIGNLGLDYFSKALSGLTLLKDLELIFYSNKIRDSGIEKFSLALCCLHNLIKINLDFGYNQIREKKAIELLETLSSLEKAQEIIIKLEKNPFTQGGKTCLETVAKDLKKKVENI